MKAVILAAGVGSRLGKPYPKSLSRLPNGESILGRQIRILRAHGIKEIIIVVGFKMGLIMETFPSVYYKYNPVYYITNTSKSLLRGIEHIDDDVLWINGDVIFDEKVIERVVREEGNLVLVNSAHCGEEEVKYAIDDQECITEISKTVEQARGEAVGINKISKRDLQEFRESLKECEDDDYFEKGIEKTIRKGKKFKAVDISEFRCIEIDFLADWEIAVGLFSEED